MKAGITVVFLALVFFGGSGLQAQTPPQISPGYATNGRDAAVSKFQTAPGFVDVSSMDAIPWRDFDFWDVPAGIETKVLSRDEKSGAVTLLTYAPRGWIDPRRGYHKANEDIFLLEGDLTIDDEKLVKYSYTFLPAGIAHGPISSHHGALFLEWFNEKPDFVQSDSNAPAARAYAAVRDWNYYKKPWTVDFPPSMKSPPSMGPRLKLLRRDPDTGEMLWLNASIEMRQGLWWEVHPTFEEHFLLESTGQMVLGECLPNGMVTNKWEERSYHYRPGGIPHLGPDAHRTGFALILVHTGGPLWADYYADCSKREKAPPPR